LLQQKKRDRKREREREREREGKEGRKRRVPSVGTLLWSHAESQRVKEIRGALTYDVQHRRRVARNKRASNRVFLPCSRLLSLVPFALDRVCDLLLSLSSVACFLFSHRPLRLLGLRCSRRHAGAYSLIIHAFADYLRLRIPTPRYFSPTWCCCCRW